MTLTKNEQKMLLEAQEAVRNAQLSQQKMSNDMTTQSLFEQEERGIVEQQLDLSEELARIEHLLRGHIIKRDENGMEYWDADPNMELLNEYGVRLMMKTITMYLSKRKLLSNYNEQQINDKMYDFSIELIDLIYMKYREMGLDTQDKRKCYPMLIREIVDSVHDVYLRALNGVERSSLRKRWNLNENVGQPLVQQGGQTSLIKGFLR